VIAATIRELNASVRRSRTRNIFCNLSTTSTTAISTTAPSSNAAIAIAISTNGKSLPLPSAFVVNSSSNWPRIRRSYLEWLGAARDLLRVHFPVPTPSPLSAGSSTAS
jgi:hypothetical protein